MEKSKQEEDCLKEKKDILDMLNEEIDYHVKKSCTEKLGSQILLDYNENIDTNNNNSIKPHEDSCLDKSFNSIFF